MLDQPTPSHLRARDKIFHRKALDKTTPQKTMELNMVVLQILLRTTQAMLQINHLHQARDKISHSKAMDTPQEIRVLNMEVLEMQDQPTPPQTMRHINHLLFWGKILHQQINSLLIMDQDQQTTTPLEAQPPIT